MKLEISFATPLQIVSAPQSGLRAVFSVDYDNVKFKGEYMASEMKTGTYATVTVTWTDKSGAPVGVDGSTKWESSDPSVIECTPSEGNPLIANLHSLGPLGVVNIFASADADLGPNVRTISAPPYEVTVIAGEAVAGEISFSQSPAQEVPKHGAS